MSRVGWMRWGVAGAIALSGFASCKREERNFRVAPPHVQTVEAIPATDFHAGPSTIPIRHMPNGYEENAFAISSGKTLFTSFNCTGCHFHGGGGIGPALMDDIWIYGSEPDQIFATIVQGRPNGMPSFYGKIPDYQVWQIAAYVRSLSGLTSPQASSGRNDEMENKPNENSTPPQNPTTPPTQPSPTGS